MAESLDDLTTPLTRQEVETSIYDVLGLIGVKTTTWKEGGVVRSMITAVALVFSALSELQALIARGGFLELAEGSWLTLVARYVYNVERVLATFAAGQVTLVNSAGGVFDFDAGDLTFVNSRSGKTYKNSLSVHLGAVSTITITVEAVEAGSDSTAAPGEISALQNALTGVTCTNALSVVGRDDEEDPALRVRCAEKLGSLSPFGPWDAYNFAARNAVRADGSLIGVTRVRTVPDGFGNITTYVASESGAVTGDQDDATTDLGAINDAIQKLAAPLAVSAYVASATPVVVAPTIRVWLYNTSGLTPQQILDSMSAKLVQFIAAQPLGGNVIEGALGKVFLDAMRTAIGSALPQIFHVQIDSPAADVELSINEVAVLGTVTFAAVTQVPPSTGSL